MRRLVRRLVQRPGWQVTPDVLVPFARWCPMWDGSFDTRFYLADLGTGAVDITVDLTENTHLFWATAADAYTYDPVPRRHASLPDAAENEYMLPSVLPM